MSLIHSLLVYTHILFGAVALSLFWLPVVAKKGGRRHRQVGRYYASAMYAVAVSALLSCLLLLIDPVGIRRPGETLDTATAANVARGARMGGLFLLMLAVLTFASVRHGLLALRERRQPGVLRSPMHRGLLLMLGGLGLVVAGIGLAYANTLLLIFGGISIVVSISMFRETLPQRLTATQRTIAHLGGLIGSGIGAHTAFFAFGGARFFADLLPGQWQTLAWVIAPMVGTVAIIRLNRRYHRADTTTPVVKHSVQG